ncbi:MAG TPA: 2-dehydropantoate 2-reductase [Polyangiaceae bacterium]
MKILIVGSGAVGGYYGAVLARGGHDVTFVARGEHGRLMAEHGLTVETPDGEFTVTAPVLPDVQDAAGLDVDLAIVAVKSTALDSAVTAGVDAALGPSGVALPLLNGVDSEEVLARALGESRVVGGIAQIAARLVSPGRVQMSGPSRLVIAPLSSEQMPLVERLAAKLSSAGLVCEAKRDLKRILWTKLLWNAPFNAICALTRKNAGEVLAVPELATLVHGAMLEVAAVARAEGVVIDEAFIESTLASTRAKFADSVPSMLQDVLAGRATETRALQGAVTHRGSIHGISTPIHQTLMALMLGLE